MCKKKKEIRDMIFDQVLAFRLPKNAIFLMVSEGYGPISGEKRPIWGHMFDQGYIIDHFFKTGFEEKYVGLGGETVGAKTTKKKPVMIAGFFWGIFAPFWGGKWDRDQKVCPQSAVHSNKRGYALTGRELVASNKQTTTSSEWVRRGRGTTCSCSEKD